MKQAISWIGAVMAAALPACGGATGIESISGAEVTSATGSALETSHAAERGRPLAVACERLVSSLQLANTVFTSATSVAAGELQVAGKPVPTHCVLTGQINRRVSPERQAHLEADGIARSSPARRPAQERRSIRASHSIPDTLLATSFFGSSSRRSSWILEPLASCSARRL